MLQLTFSVFGDVPQIPDAWIFRKLVLGNMFN